MPGSELYTYLQGTFYNSLPSDLKSTIKPTRVISGYGCIDSNNMMCYESDNNGNNFITTDKLYLFSGPEVYGVDLSGYNLFDSAASTTHQLEYYSNNGVSIDTSSFISGTSEFVDGTNFDKVIKQYQENNLSWWLRQTFNINDMLFGAAYDDGSGYGYLADRSTIGIAPAFRIG